MQGIATEPSVNLDRILEKPGKIFQGTSKIETRENYQWFRILQKKTFRWYFLATAELSRPYRT
jgi:hypothetical protein